MYFLGKVSWTTEGDDRLASLTEVDVLARGNQSSVPAILEAAEDWDVAIHNHPGGDLTPSSADVSIASELGSRSVGFVIISNDASRHYQVTAPFPRQEVQPIDLDEIREIFAPGGALARGCEGFEARGGQLEMALEVGRALNEGRVLAAEAGTGVGKSFAYLVPAALWATRNKERVVISTGTINLQEQLVGKDLPLLGSVLPVTFRYALVKGRGNYACLRKVEELARDPGQEEILADPGEQKMLHDLVEWAGSTSDGSRADLSWVPPPSIWEEVMSETDRSLKVNCKHFQQCFYYRAKRAASNAQILIANHHLFFADLSVRRQTSNYQYDAVIPAYKRVIFDEAHHLEDVASEYFGVRFTKGGILTRLGRLKSRKDEQRGTIPSLVRRLRGYGDAVSADALERAFATSLPEARSSVERLLEEVEDRIVETLTPVIAAGERVGAGAGTSTPESPADGGALQLRHRHDDGREDLWRDISLGLEDIQRELTVLLRVSDRTVQTLKGASLKEEHRRGLLLEMTSVVNRLEGLLDQIEVFRDFDDESQVRWFTRKKAGWRRRGYTLEFGSAPIRVAEALKSHVLEPMQTVVLTSATLSVAGDIDFLGDRLGLSLLDKDRFRFEQYASPFDYRHQVLTVVPDDFPPPESPQYARSIPEAIYELVKATRGRAFVLFTSYSLLRRSYQALEERLLELGLRPSAQGDASRSDLLRRFKASSGGVLFATDSFWEGVDVKGSALECVIITRLPFRVPSEPVQEARMEDLQQRGGNAFMEYTVPQAVLKFKQGFGRLIRASTDRGVVAVLDRRVLSKPYGKLFLKSLPETTLFRSSLAEGVREAGAFLGGPCCSTTQEKEGE